MCPQHAQQAKNNSRCKKKGAFLKCFLIGEPDWLKRRGSGDSRLIQQCLFFPEDGNVFWPSSAVTVKGSSLVEFLFCFYFLKVKWAKSHSGGGALGRAPKLSNVVL